MSCRLLFSPSPHPMKINRRQWLAAASTGAAGIFTHHTFAAVSPLAAVSGDRSFRNLRITAVRITPIALPDPPILAASGAHGPYFLRNIIEIETNAGISGVGETRGGEVLTKALEAAVPAMIGESPFAHRKFQAALKGVSPAVYAGIELACLDLMGRATGLRLCELLGGPVRDRVEFCSYLFYRYAADHPIVFDDPQLVDERGRGDRALDPWGEVLTPESMAEMAWRFKEKWGFRYHKLKAGVLSPEVELETMRAINARFGGKEALRIDPNGRWTIPTALRIGAELKDLPLDYYEDPVSGQEAMAEVRRKSGLKMSTNMCVTRFEHLPDAVRNEPVDIVLADHHSFGGIATCQALGAFADTVGWALSQHSNNHGGLTMAAMIHLGAVVPQLTYASDTHYVWLPEGADILVGPNLEIKEGCMTVPSGPGLGVDLDRSKLEVAHDRYLRSGMRARNDGRMMLRFVPEWKRTLF